MTDGIDRIHGLQCLLQRLFGQFKLTTFEVVTALFHQLLGDGKLRALSVGRSGIRNQSGQQDPADGSPLPG